MNVISLTCPHCGANLRNIDANWKQCYCQYCGTKILIDDGNRKFENFNYTVDSARMKELEMQERREAQERADEERHKVQCLVMRKKLDKPLIILAITTFLLFMILAVFPILKNFQIYMSILACCAIALMIVLFIWFIYFTQT